MELYRCHYGSFVEEREIPRVCRSLVDARARANSVFTGSAFEHIVFYLGNSFVRFGGEGCPFYGYGALVCAVERRLTLTVFAQRVCSKGLHASRAASGNRLVARRLSCMLRVLRLT